MKTSHCLVNQRSCGEDLPSSTFKSVPGALELNQRRRPSQAIPATRSVYKAVVHNSVRSPVLSLLQAIACYRIISEPLTESGILCFIIAQILVAIINRATFCCISWLKMRVNILDLVKATGSLLRNENRKEKVPLWSTKSMPTKLEVLCSRVAKVSSVSFVTISSLPFNSRPHPAWNAEVIM
ncbi:hypothetical protein Tco_1571392 [Tanacetum coccineum]